MSKADPYREDVKWSPRVPRHLLMRLYEHTCGAVWDAELIDDVGMTLYMRCCDILKIHRAQVERLVTCPRCERAGRESLIRRGGRDVVMICPHCDWAMT